MEIFFFFDKEEDFIKKCKAHLSTPGVYTGTIKASPQKEKTQTNPQGSTLKPETHKDHPKTRNPQGAPILLGAP
jgi:hypothetical protein